MTSYLKWPKKQTSVLSNQDEELLERLEDSKEVNVLDPQPGTPPNGRTKRSHSLYAMFQSTSKDKEKVSPVDDAPTPQRHSLVDVKSNQSETDLETPSLLKPQQKNADKKGGSKFLEGTNKWIETTKRRLTTAAAVIPRRTSTASNPNVDTDRYVGESVHTAAGAGAVVEVKSDGSSVVRLATNEYVNCSMVIVENGGEIEPLPALPQDTVITPEGVGIVINYNPKTREYSIETLDKTIVSCAVDLIHVMEKSGSITESEGSSSPNTAALASEPVAATPLRSSFLQKMAKATPKFPQLLKTRSFGTNGSVKYQAGQAVLTHFGDGIVLEVQPSTNNSPTVIVVQLSFGGTAYLQPDAIKQQLKACVGDAIQTRFGSGHVTAVAEENVFVVNVNGEEMYVHASEVQKIAAPSKGFMNLFKK